MLQMLRQSRSLVSATTEREIAATTCAPSAADRDPAPIYEFQRACGEDGATDVEDQAGPGRASCHMAC